MTLTTQRDLIRAVAKRWRDTYAPFTPASSTGEGIRNKKAISERLDALDAETVAAEEVNGIIGNDSWTSLTCDECRKEVLATVTVGQEPDYESATASLCRDCALKAAAMFK